MTIKAKVKTLEEVPEHLRFLYAEDGEGFALQVDGMVPKTKLDEFRNNNLALKKQYEDLESRFADIDPDEARALSERARKERDKKLIDAGKVDELVAERIGAMKADYDKQFKALDTEKGTLTKQLEGLVIDNAIREHAAKSGVRPTAVDDVLLRGRSLFKLVDGKAVPMDGDKPVFGKTGEPMQISEWMGTLNEKAPHLFEASNGGGAPNKGGTVQNHGGALARSDSKSFLQNVDKIAKGEVNVR